MAFTAKVDVDLSFLLGGVGTGVFGDGGPLLLAPFTTFLWPLASFASFSAGIRAATACALSLADLICILGLLYLFGWRCMDLFSRVDALRSWGEDLVGNFLCGEAIILRTLTGLGLVGVFEGVR